MVVEMSYALTGGGDNCTFASLGAEISFCRFAD